MSAGELRGTPGVPWDGGAQEARVLFLALPRFWRMTWGKALSLSLPVFPFLFI